MASEGSRARQSHVAHLFPIEKINSPAEARALAHQIAEALSHLEENERLAFLIDLHTATDTLTRRVAELRLEQSNIASDMARANMRTKLRRAYARPLPPRRNT